MMAFRCLSMSDCLVFQRMFLCQFYILFGFFACAVDFHVLCISQVGVMVPILVVVKVSQLLPCPWLCQ